ncbi:MAG TPA: inositol monophosphatase family protein [Ktedonobacteraceae bacterium]|nr:inositol monophosphatase family protein [Ktedonobacteraceae bacterium]
MSQAIAWAAVLEVAKEAAYETGEYLRDKQKHVQALGKKAMRDTLLDADLEAERRIIHKLRSAYPAAGFLSEEAGELSTGAAYQWVIDPLDGSANFEHGSPTFGIAISLAVQSETTLGVIYLPRQDEMFTVVRGHGARLNGQPIHVASTQALNDAVIHLADFAKDGNVEENERRLGYIRQIAQQVRCVRMIGTAATDLAFVACGRADALVMYSRKSWDVEVGTLLVSEAGGRVFLSQDEKGRAVSLYSNEQLCDPLMTLLHMR